jgi:UDPglucose 6-dehydrogenase
MDKRTSTKNKKSVDISVIGLGKLGACYVAFCASRGLNVIGVDADHKKVREVRKGIAPVEEPDLQKYINKNKSRITATANVKRAIYESTATFIIVPTPSKKDGSFSLTPTLAVCNEIGKSLKKKTSYHLIVLVSTVLPGNCREDIIPTIERASGKKCGEDFGFCYSPSLIAIGDVIYNLTSPDFLFLGAYDKKSDQVLSSIYKKLYPIIHPEHMSIESAELAKIALNSYITMKITFANTLGTICNKIPHANVDHITMALGKDKRIGSHYIKSGLGFGGPCFPRDNTAFAHMAHRRGVKTPLALATDNFNKHIPKNVSSSLNVIGREHKSKRIGFLGVSYKPNTTLIEESQALFIAESMLGRGYSVAIFEPLGHHEAKSYFDKKALYHDTLEKLVDWSEIIFISNKDARFRKIVSCLKNNENKKVIVDPWGMFKHDDFPSTVIYHAIGRQMT